MPKAAISDRDRALLDRVARRRRGGAAVRHHVRILLFEREVRAQTAALLAPARGLARAPDVGVRACESRKGVEKRPGKDAEERAVNTRPDFGADGANLGMSKKKKVFFRDP